ncbi:hypothetical protein D3C71_668210 [compost metagenome]
MEKGLDDPQRLFVQIFRQIVDGRLDLVMYRMPLLVGRSAHRHQFQLEAGEFQAAQFLRDKGL